MLVRPSLPALAACFFAFFVTADSQAETSAQSDLASHLPGLEIARCMFPQGKLVLQRGESFHVLRRGDAVPGEPGLKVLEITDRHAILIQGPRGSGPSDTPAIPERLVKIEKRHDGEVTVTVMSARMPRVEGPQQQDDATVYSPWSSAAGVTDGLETAPRMAPLVEPVRVPEDGAEPPAGEGSAEEPPDGPAEEEERR